MTDLPQWAMEKAERASATIGHGLSRNEHALETIARALVEAEARGIERAAALMERMPDKTILPEEEVERTGMFVRDVGNKDRAEAVRKLKNNPNQ